MELVSWCSDLAVGWTTTFRSPAGARKGILSLRNHFQTGSRVHSASYPICARGSFPEGISAGAWSWPLTSI